MSDPKQAAMPQMSTEQFMELVKELRRAPDPTPQQLAEIEQTRRMREDRARIELEKQERQKLERSMCDHSREDGTGACVPVYNNQGGIDFLACQQCQAIIHFGERPTGDRGKDTEHHIFDTAIFNRELRRYGRRPTTVA